MCFIGRESGNFVYISRLIYSGSLHDLLTLFIICTLRGRVEADEVEAMGITFSGDYS